jgi:hypothetical protein
VKEACKRFLISRFEPVYLQELADPITKFKGASIKVMIAFLNHKYPAEPEKVSNLETELREQSHWKTLPVNQRRRSGQFEGACIKWKAFPDNDRSTIAQIRTFFSRKYDIFDAQQNSLHYIKQE